MYVQLTVELVTMAVKLFCKRKGMEMEKKDAKKVFASLVDDDDVVKHYFCGVTCKKSRRACMKEVDDDDSYCHVHDPDRKCSGTTTKGIRCGSAAKSGEEYCWRHLGGDAGVCPPRRTKKAMHKSWVTMFGKEYKHATKTKSKRADTSEGGSDEDAPADSASDEDAPPPRKKRSKKPHTPEYVVDSEEEALSEDEPAPGKKKSIKSTNKPAEPAMVDKSKVKWKKYPCDKN
ncbi:hypothetical protein EDD11_003261 [Mortierella claussenii]|nr:hypothetical protein EDD11_003261 [Mortierella claussenii]